MVEKATLVAPHWHADHSDAWGFLNNQAGKMVVQLWNDSVQRAQPAVILHAGAGLSGIRVRFLATSSLCFIPCMQQVLLPSPT